MTVEEQGGTTEVEQIGSVTSDLTEENVQKLIELFPDVATEVRDPVTGEVVKGVNPEALLDRIGKTAGGGGIPLPVSGISSHGRASVQRRLRHARRSQKPCGRYNSAARTGMRPKTSILKVTISTH
jgi:hypothetical protein